MRHLTLSRAVETVLLAFVAVAILWKGGKSLDATWLLPGVLLLCTLEASREHRIPAVPVPLWMAVIGFLLWSTVSYALSLTSNYGLDEILRDGSLLLLLLVALRWSATRAERVSHGLLKTLAVATLVACAIGVAVYALQPVNRFVGSFFDYRFTTDYWPNAWAEFLLLSWPALAWWSLHGERRWLKLLGLGAALGCLLLSYSRGAGIAFGGQVVVLAALVVWRGGGVIHLRTAAVRSVTLVALAAVTFFSVNLLRAHFHDVQDIGAKVTFTADEGASSISERAQFWRQAWTLSLERPVFGWGPYSFRFIQPSLQTGVLQTSDHAHNVFLKLAQERGWPSVLLYMAILGLCLAPALRRLARREARPTDTWLLLGVLGVLAHNLIDYNLQFVGIALPFTLALGLLAWEPPRDTHAGAQRVVEAGLCLILLLVTVREGVYLAESSFGRRAMAVGDAPTAERWFERARGEWFSRDMHLSRFVLAFVRRDTAAMGRALDDYEAQNALDGRAWLQRLEERLAQGDDEGAVNALLGAQRLGSYNNLAYLRRWFELAADPDFLQPDPEHVRTILEAYRQAFAVNAHFILQSSNVEHFAAICDHLQKQGDPLASWCGQAVPEVLTHAEKVKSSVTARPPGYLW